MPYPGLLHLEPCGRPLLTHTSTGDSQTQFCLSLLIAKFRLKFKEVGEPTRPIRYDLNQIPYDYTVEVRNRFKGIDLTDRVPEKLWLEVHDIVQEAGIKTIPTHEKEMQKGKMVV